MRYMTDRANVYSCLSGILESLVQKRYLDMTSGEVGVNPVGSTSIFGIGAISNLYSCSSSCSCS